MLNDPIHYNRWDYFSMLVLGQNVCIFWIQINSRPRSPWLDNHVFNISARYIWFSMSEQRFYRWIQDQRKFLIFFSTKFIYNACSCQMTIQKYTEDVNHCGMTALKRDITLGVSITVFLYVTYRWIGEVTFLTTGRGIEDCQFHSLILMG